MIYPNFFQNMARGRFDLQTDDLRVLLLDASYTFDPLHDARNDIPDSAVVAESAADLPSKSVTLSNGQTIVLCDPITFFAVTGDPITQAVLYKRVSNPAQGWLISHYPALAGLPITPTGGNLVVNLGTKVLSLGNELPPPGGGDDMDVVTYNQATADPATITRTSSRMFVNVVGPFGTLNLPTTPQQGDELLIKCATLAAGATSSLAADSIEGAVSYRFTQTNQSVHLVRSGSAWKIAAEALRDTTKVIATAGNHHNVDMTGYDAIRCTDDTAFTYITGMTPPPADVHKVVWIHSSLFGVFCNHNDSGSAVANRFDFGSGAAKGATTKGSFPVYYDHTAQRWRVGAYPDA